MTEERKRAQGAQLTAAEQIRLACRRALARGQSVPSMLAAIVRARPILALVEDDITRELCMAAITEETGLERRLIERALEPPPSRGGRGGAPPPDGDL